VKTSAVLLGSILALSLGVWALFYFLTAGEPLTPAETLVIVGMCGASVLAVRWIWSCIWKGRERHADDA